VQVGSIGLVVRDTFERGIRVARKGDFIRKVDTDILTMTLAFWSRYR
jgi:hypothetical protein